MASTASILDYIADTTGFSKSGQDRILALNMANVAYQEAVEAANAWVDTFTLNLTAGVSDYDLSTVIGSDALKILQLQVNGVPVDRVEEGRMRQWRGDGATDAGFTVLGTNKLLVNPAPGTGQVLKGTYVKAADTLTDSNSSGPAMIPSSFHYSVIGDGAIMRVLRVDNRWEEAREFERAFNESVQKLREHVSQFAGRLPPIRSKRNWGYIGPRDLYPPWGAWP